MFCKRDSATDRELIEGVRLQTLVHGEKTLMGRFTIRKNSQIPSHRHPHEQTGYLISGTLLFTVENEKQKVEPGDSWCIPGGSEHSAVALEDSVVLEVFSPVRSDYLPK